MILYLLMIDSAEDQSKFEKIYLEYRGLMYHLAYEILHNRQDAEDAVHQAFVKIAENIEIIDVSIPSKLRGLVVTIVENKAIDMQRYHMRHQTIDIDSCQGISIEYQGENRLTACMAKLPAKYRSVLLLKHLHGYSSKETAKILGITEANVIKIDQRAKKKLQELCMEEGLLW